LTLLAFAGWWWARPADAAPSDAARVIARMRTAATNTDFTGTVAVTWRAASGAQKHATVDVRSAGGVLELTSTDNRVVLDENGRTFVRNDLGWSSPVSEPPARDKPAPDARWQLDLRHTQALGRPVTVIVARRADDAIAQRLVVDDASDLLVRRDVVDRDGAVERSFRFTSLVVQPTTAAVPVQAPTATERNAKAVRATPDGYHAPDRLGAGFVLVSRATASDGFHLVYSDGLFSLSVLEQQGDLDWDALPGVGIDTSVDGQHARLFVQPLGSVVVWERDGMVFTCVSDAPGDVMGAALTGLDPDSSVVDRVVDYVLGPFSFD